MRWVTTDGPFVKAKEHLGGFYVDQTVQPTRASLWLRPPVAPRPPR